MLCWGPRLGYDLEQIDTKKSTGRWCHTKSDEIRFGYPFLGLPVWFDIPIQSTLQGWRWGKPSGKPAKKRRKALDLKVCRVRSASAAQMAFCGPGSRPDGLKLSKVWMLQSEWRWAGPKFGMVEILCPLLYHSLLYYSSSSLYSSLFSPLLYSFFNSSIDFSPFAAGSFYVKLLFDTCMTKLWTRATKSKHQ